MSTTLPTPAAELTFTRDLQPLRRAIAWARENGWQTGYSGPTWQSPDRLTGVDYDPDDKAIKVARRGNRRAMWPIFGRWYPVSSPRQAIDLLVVLGVLPAELSSAYEAGRRDAFESLGRAA